MKHCKLYKSTQILSYILLSPNTLTSFLHIEKKKKFPKHHHSFTNGESRTESLDR